MIGEDAAAIVAVLPSWVGDTVMATPVLRVLRRTRPSARLIGVMRPGLDEVLGGTPWLDEVVIEELKSVTGPFRAARRVRRLAGRPDACLVLPNSFRAALAARLTGARRRIGYRRLAGGGLLTDALDPGDRREPVSAVEYYAQLAESALVGVAIERRLELAVTDEQHAASTRLLEGVEPPFLVLNPGANRSAKRWPASRFAAVARELAADPGLAVVVTGAPAERDVVEAVVAACPGAIDLVSRGVGLGSLKGIIRQARLVVTNDTGPRLIAAALGTPVVTLYGPTDPRWTTTVCPGERAVVAEPFLEAGRVADREPDRCAVTRIAIGDVVAASRALLAAPATSADATPPEPRAATPPPAGESR